MTTREGGLAAARVTPLLAGLPARVVDLLLAHAVIQVLPAGTRLFEQGESATHLHVVLAGRVGLVAEAEDRGEAVIEFFTTGDSIIAPAVILDLPYLVGGRVVEESRLLLVPAADVRHLLDADSAFARTMLRELARHWRLLVRQLKDLKLRGTSERLASYLLMQDRQADGRVRLREERKLLAQRLAMTPESLSRAFATLRDHGVTATGRDIVLADVERLRRHCGFDEIR